MPGNDRNVKYLKFFQKYSVFVHWIVPNELKTSTSTHINREINNSDKKRHRAGKLWPYISLTLCKQVIPVWKPPGNLPWARLCDIHWVMYSSLKHGSAFRILIPFVGWILGLMELPPHIPSQSVPMQNDT